jgi:hypothetical protein
MQKINWAHARKKGYMQQIAAMVQQHDAATPNEQVHLRVGFAVFVQQKFLYLETAPCVYCGGNAAYMDEARGIVAAEPPQDKPKKQQQLEELPTVEAVDDTRKKSKTKREKESNITETE